MVAFQRFGRAESIDHWPRDRYLELAPKYWRATRGRLRPDELASPISAFEVPAPPHDSVELVAVPAPIA